MLGLGLKIVDQNIAHASISTDNIIKILHNPSWKLCMTSPKTATMETRVTQLKMKSTWESELSQDNYIYKTLKRHFRYQWTF